MKDSIKVVVVGSCGCGKTSIINRLANDTFSAEHISTEGASFNQIEFTFPEYQNKILNMEIWDTAGQEQYRALSKIFYKDADAAILVYDTTNKESYKDIKEYWLDQVKEYGGQNLSKNHIHVYIHIYL
jgi:small GTP-binding protein